MSAIAFCIILAVQLLSIVLGIILYYRSRNNFSEKERRLPADESPFTYNSYAQQIIAQTVNNAEGVAAHGEFIKGYIKQMPQSLVNQPSVFEHQRDNQNFDSVKEIKERENSNDHIVVRHSKVDENNSRLLKELSSEFTISSESNEDFLLGTDTDIDIPGEEDIQNLDEYVEEEIEETGEPIFFEEETEKFEEVIINDAEEYSWQPDELPSVDETEEESNHFFLSNPDRNENIVSVQMSEVQPGKILGSPKKNNNAAVQELYKLYEKSGNKNDMRILEKWYPELFTK